MAASLRYLVPALMLAMLLNPGARAAEALKDPTRPAFESVSTETQAAPRASHGLQSVILSTKREAAIINGIEVEVGHKYGNAVLSVVNETCVVLVGPEGRQVMHMYPTVNLSKTELACAGRSGLATIRKLSHKPAKKKKPKRKPAQAKKKVVTCVDDDGKNGSGK